jgi:hypothetical protein
MPDAEISEFISRVLAEEKKTGKRAVSEGKRALTSNTYHALVKPYTCIKRSHQLPGDEIDTR